MATGQSILDRMEILHPEIQLQTGESDVTKGLIAANMAQDYFEAVLALQPDVFGGTSSTVTTTALTETTAYPTGLLRIDKLQYLDPTTLRPAWDVDPLYTTGGHAPSQSWPVSIASTVTGAPKAYWTNGRLIYWDPLPDATHTIRWYGLQAQTDLTAGGTFQYPDLCLTPLATFAVKCWRIGLDDAADALQALADELFQPVVAALAGFRREEPRGLIYRYGHVT